MVGGFLGYNLFVQQEALKKISSYEECVAAGFASMESYPPQCKTSDGRSFTQNIGNELEYHDEILIENPRPNQKISSPITVRGKVRGNWLFEASFSGELFDANDKSLGTVILQAQGEWMTIDFVPFTGELVFSTPETETGTLKIINANPSGLPENNKTILMPVRFQ